LAFGLAFDRTCFRDENEQREFQWRVMREAREPELQSALKQNSPAGPIAAKANLRSRLRPGGPAAAKVGHRQAPYKQNAQPIRLGVLPCDGD